MKQSALLLLTGLALGGLVVGCKPSSRGNGSSGGSSMTDGPTKMTGMTDMGGATKMGASAMGPSKMGPTKMGGPRPGDVPAPDDVAAAPAGAERTESGIASRVLTPGDGGAKPQGKSSVTVHYTGWQTNGRMFDSSSRRNRPATFRLDQVIPGWTEGVQLMTKGEKRRFWIPENLAYGSGGRGPSGMLVFDIELLDFQNPPPAPADVAAAPAGSPRSESGLAWRVLTEGTGETPEATSRVKVHYTGWTSAGEMFDSSVMNGRPASFRLDRVIPGWTEGVQLMKVGEKRRFWIPANLAYGETPRRPGAPAGNLTFDIELLEIMAAPPPRRAPPEHNRPAPDDVAAVPSNAETTASGLASRVITPGTGTEHPTATQTVKVHYSGWTLDGRNFDSSYSRNEPTEFPLNGVIGGWTEGVQLMVVGETRRFWIPANLAYGENPRGGRPGGMLVFDIELLEIK